MKTLTFFLFLVSTFYPVFAQHPFYLQIYRDAKASMELENFDKSKELFEIAAFGFLDHPDYLLSCRVHLALIFNSTDDTQALSEMLISIKSLRNKIGEKHSQIDESIWKKYLVLTGEMEPPAKPLPDNESDLKQLLKREPERKDAWRQYLSLLGADKGRSEAKRALKYFPEDLDILELALGFEQQTGSRKTYVALAQKILALNPEHSFANEVLGLEAFQKKRNFEALDYFQHVTHFRLPESEGALEKLKAEVDAVKSDEQEKVVPPESEPIEKEKPKSDPDSLDIKGLETQIDQNPADIDSRFLLVKSYLKQNKLRKTKKQLEILGLMDPKDPRYLEAFAEYHYQKKNYEQVVHSLENFSELTDRSYYFLGRCYLGLSDNAKALKTFQKIQYKDSFLDLPFLMANLSETTSQASSEIGDWLEGPINREQKIKLLLDLLDQDNKPLFEEFRLQFEKEFPDDMTTRYFKARGYLMSQDYEQASDLFYWLANNGFKDYEIFYYGGISFQKINKLFITKYMFEKALESGSEFEPEIREKLASLNLGNQ